LSWSQVWGWIGVSFDGIWDESALTGFDPKLALTLMNCLVLAAQEGYY
jgi:hypothetical protein